MTTTKKSELLKIEIPLCGGNRELAVQLVKARLAGATEAELESLRGQTSQDSPSNPSLTTDQARDILSIVRPELTVDISTEGVPFSDLDRVWFAVAGKKSDQLTIAELDEFSDAAKDFVENDAECQRLIAIHKQEKSALADWYDNRRKAFLALTGGAFDYLSYYRFNDDGSFSAFPSQSSDESRYLDGKLVSQIHHGCQSTSKDAWIKGTRHDR